MSGYCVECGDKAVGLGLCAKHYMRQRRAGMGRTHEERKKMRMEAVNKAAARQPRQLPAEKRGGMAKSVQQHEPAAIKLPYLRFLDPAHQRVKTS